MHLLGLLLNHVLVMHVIINVTDVTKRENGTIIVILVHWQKIIKHHIEKEMCLL